VTIAALAVASLVVLAYLFLAVIAIRRPLLTRIAYRQVVRRPWQSALMVAGMVFGSAAILAMATLTDWIEGMLNQTLLDSWGNVDLIVSNTGRPFSLDVASQLRADPSVAGRVAGVTGGQDLAGSVGDLDRSLSVSTVQLIGMDQATGDALGSFHLIDGSELNPSRLGTGEAVIADQLAERIQAQVGDRLTVRIARPGTASASLELRLVGTARRGPGAAYGRVPALFLPLTDLQRLSGIEGINVVRIRARGAGMAEVQAGHEAAPAVRRALTSIANGAGLDLREVKADDLNTNAQAGAGIRPVFIALSALVVVGAMALVVNLFLALAAERRPRLAVLRALGLSRGGMAAMSLMEAGFYGLAGSVVGVIPGLAYAAYEELKPLPEVSFTQISSPTASYFGPTMSSVVFAVSCGILVSLITIAMAGLRASRMSISSAIKELPDPAAARTSWRRWGWIGCLGLAGVLCLAVPFVILRAVGGTLVIIAATAALRGRVPERARANVAGAALTAWALSLPFRKADNLNLQLSLALMAIFAGVWGVALLVSANLAWLERLAAVGSVRVGAVLRPPLAYLTRRPTRTALTTGTFGLVLAGITFSSFIFATLRQDYRAFTNNWDVVMTSAGNPALSPPAAVRDRIASQMAITTATYVGPTKSTRSSAGSTDWNQGYMVFLALSDEQFDHPPIRLNSRAAGYSSDAEAWRAVRDNPSLAIGNYAQPRDRLLVGSPTQTVPFDLVGGSGSPILQPQFALWYVVSQRGLDRLHATGLGTTLLLQVTPGTDPATVALDARRSLYAEGVDAVTTRHLYDALTASGQWYWSLFTDLLDASLVVGILSLAILALRAVIERRRSIGVLRALGYQPSSVLVSLIVEVLVAATIGVAAGVAVGLATGYGLLLASPSMFPHAAEFRIDPMIVLLPIALVLGAVLIASLGPALRASRIPPAEALRIVD